MPTVKVLLGFSATIGQGVGLVSIRIFLRDEFLFLYPLSGISTGECHSCWDRCSSLGWCCLCLPSATDFYTRASQAAKDDSSSREKLIDVFNRIEHFFHRLETYISIKPSTAMTNMVVEIMVQVLTILALATKEVKRERLSELMSYKSTILYSYFYLERVFRKLTGNTDLEDSLQRLDRLTQEEARMASAEQLKMAQNIDDKLGLDIRSLLSNSHSDGANFFTGNQLRDYILRWLSPSDQSTNHIIACKARHNGTAQWFFDGSIFNEWKSTGSFLWIHGKRASLLAFTCNDL
jgi:hypothetical protein